MTSKHEDSASALADAEVRELVAAGRAREAAATLIPRLSAELKSFTYRLLGNLTLADEAYSATCERLWRGLENFRWECSLRSWSYTVARREASRCRKRQARRTDNQTTLSSAEQLPAQLPSTGHALSTTRRGVMADLHASLSDEDRDLIVLRVERGMAWKEIAAAFLEEDELNAELIEREAARLRQRFRSIRQAVLSSLADRKANSEGRRA